MKKVFVDKPLNIQKLMNEMPITAKKEKEKQLKKLSKIANKLSNRQLKNIILIIEQLLKN